MFDYKTIEIPIDFILMMRNYSGDKADLNRIIDGTENSDDDIRAAAQRAIQRFNSIPPLLDARYLYANFPDMQLLADLTLVQLLQTSALIEARNSISIQDAGFQLSTGVKAPTYAQIAAQLSAETAVRVTEFKKGLNAEEGFDALLSPESGIFYGYY